MGLRLLSRLSPAARVAAGLLSLAITLLLILDLVLGIFPNAQKQVLESRQRIAETTAVQLAILLGNDGQRHVRPVLNELMRRESSLRSVGIRGTEGRLLAATAAHQENWEAGKSGEMGRSMFLVPINTSGTEAQRWGQVELVFTPLAHSFMEAFVTSPATKLILVFSLIGGAIYYLYLRRTFQNLDPAAAVPERVQMAFDAMSEAVLVLNDQGRIVMHNSSFEALLPEAGEPIVGRDPATFAWMSKSVEYASNTPPWSEAMRTLAPVQGIAYESRLPGGDIKRLVVNASPVLDGRNAVRGCMVSFSDVTELEEGRRQLVSLMTELAASKEQLELQNQELQRLANVDPMTGALNRRSFFPIFERMFREAGEQKLPFSFVMCDIDKFKGINDTYGHQAGDTVIQKFAAILLRSARDSDVVCRYGGEEFCIALPATDSRQARVFAERIRETVEAEMKLCIENLTDRRAITVSMGIASLDMGAASASELADQADQALYHSKNTGRNRCTVYSRLIAGKQEEEASV